jgi:aryl-alcohol dehydrogenase-like predicted oxidoreductase
MSRINFLDTADVYSVAENSGGVVETIIENAQRSGTCDQLVATKVRSRVGMPQR